MNIYAKLSLLALLSANTFFGMERPQPVQPIAQSANDTITVKVAGRTRELKEPSTRTRNAVEKALKAFDIPVESVNIYEEVMPGPGAWANSDKRQICIDEFITDDDRLTYTSFHEVAHIKDSANSKIRSHKFWATASVALASYAITSSTAFGFKKIASFANRHPWRFMGSFIGINTLGPLWFGILFDNPMHAWATEQAEHRADRMACEKLIELNEIKPIAEELASKKLLEKTFGNTKRHAGHAPAGNEFKRFEETLKNHGFTVTTAKSEQNPADLLITISKDNIAKSSACLTDYNSKI